MGKQVTHQSENEPQVESLASENKKSLNKFLPYDKYTDLKNRIFKKRVSKAIKNISLDKNQIKKAVESLLKYVELNKNPTDLVSKQEFIYVAIDLSRIPEQHSVRPIQIELPHPIYSSDLKSRYTIITSDENEEALAETADQIEVPMLREIISYQKIKKNYKQYGDKKQLLAANDLFFCDWKIYNLLRQPLGKQFYDEKKFPFPIDCDGEVPEYLKEKYNSYESYLNSLASSTYTMLGNGPVYTIKIGRTRMTPRELVKNIMHGAYSLIANLLDTKVQPEHVRQISIKTYNSPSLPIYNFLTAEEIAVYTGK